MFHWKQTLVKLLKQLQSDTRVCVCPACRSMSQWTALPGSLTSSILTHFDLKANSSSTDWNQSLFTSVTTPTGAWEAWDRAHRIPGPVAPPGGEGRTSGPTRRRQLLGAGENLRKKKANGGRARQEEPWGSTLAGGSNGPVFCCINETDGRFSPWVIGQCPHSYRRTTSSTTIPEEHQKNNQQHKPLNQCKQREDEMMVTPKHQHRWRNKQENLSSET